MIFLEYKEKELFIDIQFNTAEHQFKFSLQLVLQQRNSLEQHLKGDQNVLEVFILICLRVSWKVTALIFLRMSSKQGDQMPSVDEPMITEH